jgi:hypothetical protein
VIVLQHKIDKGKGKERAAAGNGKKSAANEKEKLNRLKPQGLNAGGLPYKRIRMRRYEGNAKQAPYHTPPPVYSAALI